MQRYFLLTIGYYNLLGSITLYLMINRVVAACLLKRWAFIFSDTFNEQHGPLWLCWAATSNFFYGLVNLAAVDWDVADQKALLYSNLLIYIIFLGLALLLEYRQSHRRRDYRRSYYLNLFLFTIWVFWAIACLSNLE